MQNKFVISLIIAVIVAGGLGFYGGVIYQKQQAPVGAPAFAGRGTNGQSGAFAGRGGAGGFGRGGNVSGGSVGNFSAGEVVNADTHSLTLKLMDGSSKIVLFASSTHIGKMTDGTTNDLKAGTNVMVTGNTNSDGSITASNIQIRPAGMPDGGFRGGRGGIPSAGQPTVSGQMMAPPQQP